MRCSCCCSRRSPARRNPRSRRRSKARRRSICAGWEASGGREYARILEFDLQARRWSARELHYALDAPGHTIADLATIDARLALVVERGPQYRRLYKVLFDGEQARKLAYVELLAIKMATVEGLELIDPGYAVLTNGDRREFVLLRAPAIVGAP